jgi:transcriptional regulator with XRE-family HTH domain
MTIKKDFYMEKKNNLKKFKEMVGEISLGQRLKVVRELAGLTQADLGKNFRKSTQFISDIEHMRRSISFNTVLNYALHCEYDVTYLLSKYYEYTLQSSGIKNLEVLVREKDSKLKKSA